MKFTLRSGFGLLLLSFLTIFAACSVIEQDELVVLPVDGSLGNQVFDCPDLQHNMADTCLTSQGTPGLVSDSCFCAEMDTSTTFCPNLGLTYLDTCMLADSTLGTVQGNCQCFPIYVPPAYDCPDSRANIGDICRDTIVGTDTIPIARIAENCECVDVPFSIDFACLELQANPRDTCYGTNYRGEEYVGTVTDTCGCEPIPIIITYDCPQLQLNVSDTCMTTVGVRDTTLGLLTADCNCDLLPDEFQFDCTYRRWNVGDPCIIPHGGLPGKVTENCNCE